MSHWYVPSSKEEAANRWTDAEIAALVALKAAGNTYDEIAHVIGRSKRSISGKLEYLNLTAHQREERRQAQRRRRIADGTQSTRLHPNGQIVSAGRPSSDLLHARDVRLAIPPRDLTAAFLGDPLPGFSALDRKHQGQSA